MSLLQLDLVDAGICRVCSPSGLHVGNLKRIGGVWKFKAIGYTAAGEVTPGGGPLTDKHNAVFAQLDEANIHQVLFEGVGVLGF